MTEVMTEVGGPMRIAFFERQRRSLSTYLPHDRDENQTAGNAGNVTRTMSPPSGYKAIVLALLYNKARSAGSSNSPRLARTNPIVPLRKAASAMAASRRKISSATIRGLNGGYRRPF